MEENVVSYVSFCQMAPLRYFTIKSFKKTFRSRIRAHFSMSTVPVPIMMAEKYDCTVPYRTIVFEKTLTHNIILVSENPYVRTGT